MKPKRLLNTPTALKACAESWGLDAKLAAPLCMRLGNTLNRCKPARTAIVGLRFRRLPAYIARLVVSVVVNAPKRKPFWTLSEVFDKPQEIMPALANGYPTPSISGISAIPWVVAARHHEMPCLVSPRAKQSMHIVTLSFLGKTAARTCAARNQVLHKCRMHMAAVTHAFPIATSALAFGRAVQHLQAPKAPAFHI